MKRILLGLSIIISLLSFIPAGAQTQLSKYQPGITTDGAIYYLPKTAMHFIVQVEKTTYTPGEYAPYAERFLALHNVNPEKSVSYRVTNVMMQAVGQADTAKCFAVKYNAKSTASNLELADDGVLLAINSQGIRQERPRHFTPAPKPRTVNPRQFLNEEILAAGSSVKRAELIAQEIYNVRDSKNQLTRGEADYMPKDGEQLRIMLNQLDEQNQALTQLFAGVTERDTVEYIIQTCPMTAVKDMVLFRLSQHLGLVSATDLSGEPFYLNVEDLKTVPAPVVDKKKKKKLEEEGIYVNIPGRIRVTVNHHNQELFRDEFNAGQFGNVELLSDELFNKRYTTHLRLNPVNGGVELLESELVK